MSERMSGSQVRDEDLLRFEAQLRQVLYRFDCPGAHALGEYALELVPTEQRVAIASHVRECAECTEELASVRAFLAAEVQPTVGLVDRLRRVVATLLGPGDARVAFAGARRSMGGRSPLTYRAEELITSLSTGRDGRSLLGLVSWEGAEADEPQLDGHAARLVGATGSVVAEATLDAIGNFTLHVPEAPVGQEYIVELHLADRVVVMEGVRL
jgi:hypothetical protein